MMTPNMQGIIMAIGKSRNVYDRCGPEAGFFKVQLTFSFNSLMFLNELLQILYFLELNLVSYIISLFLS